MQFNDLTYASSFHYIANDKVQWQSSFYCGEYVGVWMEFFLGTRTLDSLCVELVGMKAALDDAPSLWSNPIVKVGSKEQDLKKRLDFHFLLCSMIESLVNVNTNRIFLAGVEKFWYEFCIHTLCWKFILQRSKDWMTETEIIASIQGRAQQDSRWLCGLHLFYFLAGDF